MLKIIVILLFIGVLLSLGSGLVFLFRDQQEQGSRRTLYSLGIRILLAASLLIVLFYGFSSGQLRLDAPWHNRTSLMDRPAEPEIDGL